MRHLRGTPVFLIGLGQSGQAMARWCLRHAVALVVLTVAAWFVSTPMTARFFNLVSPVGLVANLIGVVLLRGARSLNVRSPYLHVLSDALASLAVIIGGVIMWLTQGAYVLDAVLACLIALLILVSSYRLLRDAIDVLLEAVPKGLDPSRVRADIHGVPGVREVHDLHIWTITSGLRALSAHVIVADPTRNDDVLRRVKELLVRQHRIAHSTLQIESTAYDGPLH